MIILALFAVFWGVSLWKAARHEAQAEAAFPPQGDFVDVFGTPVHYVQTGSGPDVVLIHGASGNLRDMTFDLVGKLAKRYRVTVFDRPGLGYTPRLNDSGATIVMQADLLSKAALQLGVTRPVVMGQSYGGAVALAWAVQHPDRLAALVPVSAASNPWTADLSMFYKVTSGPFGYIANTLIAAWVPDRVVENAVQGVFAPQNAPQGYGAHIGAPLTLRRVSLRANARQRANLKGEIDALYTRYGDIAVPTEIVHGNADTTVGLGIHSIPLSKQIPDAELTILPGIGHMPHHVAQDAVINAIDRAANRANLRRSP